MTVEFDAESVEMGYKQTISGADDIVGFSPKFGVPRILELFAKYDVRGTFFVPGWDAERHPKSVKEIANAGHEIAAHGYIHEDFSKLKPDEERDIFHKTHHILSDLAGADPRGFRTAAYNTPLSANTLSVVREMGYTYDSSFMDHDIPYRLTIDDKGSQIIEIPWTWPLNDIVFISPPISCGLGFVMPPRTPVWVLEYWKEEFDSLLEAVGFFHLVIHPRDMGRGSRIPILDGLLDHIRRHDVEFLTCMEVAEWRLRFFSEEP